MIRITVGQVWHLVRSGKIKDSTEVWSAVRRPPALEPARLGYEPATRTVLIQLRTWDNIIDDTDQIITSRYSPRGSIQAEHHRESSASPQYGAPYAYSVFRRRSKTQYATICTFGPVTRALNTCSPVCAYRAWTIGLRSGAYVYAMPLRCFITLKSEPRHDHFQLVSLVVAENPGELT